MFMQKFGRQIRCIVGDKQFAYCKFNDWFTTAKLKVARDTFGLLSCKKLRRMHEVQRLISTSLRDMNNWIHIQVFTYSVARRLPTKCLFKSN